MVGKFDELLDKHFPGEERRPLLDLERNVSLVLHYGHPMIMDGLRPVAPNFQYIGMMNCRKPQPLPKDLEDFMRSGREHGVIYVSYGSLLQARHMSPELLRMFTNVFSKLKQKVIWKFEADDLPGKPDNLMLARWLPQQDILGHPNLKLFITHAGLNSMQELICHQKPAVSFQTASKTEYTHSMYT